MHQMPIISPELCDGCGLCVDVCVKQVLDMVNNIVTIVNAAQCGYCTDCEAVCKHGAICCPYEIVIAEYYERRQIIIEE